KLPVDDARTAEAHQLYALALKGQIIPGETERKVPVAIRGRDAIEHWSVTVEDGAILEFENALLLQPADLITATHLADLYQKADRKSTNILTELDNLLKTLPAAMRPKKLVDLLETFPGVTRVTSPDLDPKLRNSPILKESYADLLKAYPAARRL